MKFRRNEAKEWARENLRGIWAAALTPFDPNTLAIDEAAVRRNFRHWMDDLKIDGFFVAGKQGEFFSLSIPERKRVFEITMEETQGKAGAILSCSDQNMDVVLELARHAEKAGADAVLIVTPYYNKPNQEGLYQHFKAIAEAVDIPVILYNVPGRTVADMSNDTIVRLAQIPGIVGVKDATGNIARGIVPDAVRRQSQSAVGVAAFWVVVALRTPRAEVAEGRALRGGNFTARHPVPHK